MTMCARTASHLALAFAGLATSACASVSKNVEPSIAAASAMNRGCGVNGELMLHVPSPDWRDQIIFFGFTDRFADGDPSNNDQGEGEYDPSREHYFSGGDIRGVTEQLDYIEGLGATAVWITPIVYNQWKSEASDFTGYSGYYAVDFSEVDPHFGTLSDYQQLSSALHCRDMYLIKDIVVNHTGNFFGYDGEYDPQDTARNFALRQSTDARQPAPSQSPFDLIDRNNPDHAEASIYNWTPTITDYRDMGETQFTYQLGGLADINTKNPVVIETFKQVYGDWIDKAGIDALRIDTVRYVEPGFFTRFMTDENGIVARAAATGREDFLVFGEVLDYSQPYENSGEQELAKYLDRPGQPVLPSVISFPLKQEIKSVFGQGKPTAQLAYRLEQHMEMFPNPFIAPTLVDNHDVARFLTSGSMDAFKQSFALMFTFPGIPTIYQGSAQGFTETRQAMFADGYLADRDYYDTDTPLYRHISELAELRKTHPALRRGKFEVLASNQHEAGLLAYRRTYQGISLDVLFNTSDQPVLVDNLLLPGADDGSPEIIYAMNFEGQPTVQQQKLTTVLPPRAVLVLVNEPTGEVRGDDRSSLPLALASPTVGPMTQDFELEGKIDAQGEVLLVRNGSLGDAIRVETDSQGKWSYTYPVRNLGQEAFVLVAYDPASNMVSNRLLVETQVRDAAFSSILVDPSDDASGPSGTYVDLQQPNANGQKELLGANVSAGGDILRIALRMENISGDWLPPVGFDNVAFSIFFDLPSAAGRSELPQLNAAMPEGQDWDIGHVVFGWGNTMFSSEGASSTQAGKRFASAPEVIIDRGTNTITFEYDGSDFGVSSWEGASIYVTTWDIAGEGAYVTLASEPADWSFGGGPLDGPKVFDDLLITLEPGAE